ncbi:fasciclin domain-containing protein [Aquabacterium sp. A7-Y]|uniref:fasciclin domain-containing protein n=1 Tax=Aquabacterium sp. A7-Y TaxID=1349605 RepID=UPI00223C9593|nr:fasciclin domain-containing protein [Aquabacterium sp. A7-Y]MCW7540109.1 fasciclin domain-containing protein [Aquabacterium sp. A7-Y]
MHGSLLHSPLPDCLDPSLSLHDGLDGPAADLLSHIRCTKLLQVFNVLLQSTEVASTLRGEGPYRVYAPCNAAFGELPREFLEALMMDLRLASALLVHHVSRSPLQEVALDATCSPSLRGTPISLTVRADGAWYGDAKFLGDHPTVASNGTLYTVSKVLIPGNVLAHPSAARLRPGNPAQRSQVRRPQYAAEAAC